MCYTIRILYSCVFDASIIEEGCPGYDARKMTVRDNRISGYCSLPVVRYCLEGKKRAVDRSGCPRTCESVEPQDELICPLKCPACWGVFLDRLRLSPEETEVIGSKLYKEGRDKNKTEEALMTNLDGIITEFADSIVNKCVQDKVELEELFDAGVLRVAKELREDNYRQATRYLADFPVVGMKYADYEARKERFLAGYRVRGAHSP
jgi:hypothetical protein